MRSHSWHTTLLISFTTASDQATLVITSPCSFERNGGHVEERNEENSGTCGCEKYHLLHWWASNVSLCWVVVRFLTSLPTLDVLVKFTFYVGKLQSKFALKCKNMWKINAKLYTVDISQVLHLNFDIRAVYRYYYQKHFVNKFSKF